MAPRITAHAVPVTRLGDGILTRRDGSFAALLELQGVLFHLLPAEQQDQLLTRWMRHLLLGLDGPVTLVAMPEPVDVRAAAGVWRARAAADTVPPAIAEDFARLFESAADAERYTYLLAAAAPTPAAAHERGTHLIRLLDAVDHQLRPMWCGTDRAAEVLAQCFGRTLPAPASAYLRTPSVAATIVLDPPTAPVAPARRLSRRRAAPAPGTPATPAALTLAADAAAWPAPVGLMDLIAPAAWHEEPDAVQLGPDLWARTLTAVAYPPEASTGFLHGLLSVPVPRRFAWHIMPLDPHAAITALGRRIQAHETSLRGALREGRPADPYRQHRYEEATRLRDALVQNQTKLFSLRFNVTLFGRTREELALHTRLFDEAARAALFVFLPLTLEQRAGFMATLPIAWPAAGRAREIDAASLALMFPATELDVLDTRGVLLGQNLSTHSLAQVDLLDAQAFPVLHGVFVASTGGGKSYAMKTLLTQMLADADRGMDAVVIDPSRPIDYERWTAALGGTFVQLGVGARRPWNICAISYPRNFREIEEGDTAFLSEKLDFLLLLLQLLTNQGAPWEPEARAMLADTIQGLYTARGIVDGDFKSLTEPDALTMQPRLKAMPRLGDIAAALAAHADPVMRRVAQALTLYLSSGLYPFFDGPDMPPDAARLTVYNVEKVATRGEHDDVRSAVYLVLAEQMTQRLRASGRRTLLVIDEAHYLFQHADTAAWVSQLFRTARKAGGAVWLATQNVTDLVGQPNRPVAGAVHAQWCLTNSALAWLGRQDKAAELTVLQEQWQLSDVEVAFLADIAPGSGAGLWIASTRIRLATQVLAPPSLAALIRTDVHASVAPSSVPDPLNGVRPLPPKEVATNG
jgi:hypothetical protein